MKPALFIIAAGACALLTACMDNYRDSRRNQMYSDECMQPGWSHSYSCYRDRSTERWDDSDDRYYYDRDHRYNRDEIDRQRIK
jgi:hypothetical protein